MRPLHIVILVAAGAIGGAVIMKVAMQPRIAAPAPVVAQVQAPLATAPAAPATATADEYATGVPANVPPLDTPKPVREAPKAGRAQAAAASQRPAVTAQPIQRDAPPAPPAPEAGAAAPADSAPEAVPPAHPEPENVTPPPPPAPPEPHRVTLNAGTMIPVRLVDGLTSERNLPGDAFAATLDKELVADGFVIAERGARVEGRVVSCDKGGLTKSASLAVELVRLSTSDGQTVSVRTDGFERRADDSHRQNAEKVAGGAVLGAMIGAIAGGGKGAAIGAGVGGGAGAGTVMATRARAALPAETRVIFRLKSPVTITERVRG